MAFLLFALLPHSHAVSLPFTDPFDYADGNLYTVAGGVWDAGGSAGAEFVVTNSAALVSPTNFVAATGKGVKWTPSGTARRNLVAIDAVSSGEVYASFLLNIVTAPTSSRLFAYFHNTTSSITTPALGVFLNGTTLGVGKNASTPAVTTSLSAGTHLVVVRYTFLAGNDQADLWVDPSSATYGATNAPASLGSTTGSSDPASLLYFALNATSGTGPTLHIDEVRIGTSWAAVVPSGTPPPPPVPFTVTQSFVIPDGIVLRGTGGPATGTYVVVTSLDLTTSVSNWPAIATNQFDLAGNFDITNAVSPFDTEHFYAIRSGGVTNVLPPVAPVITTQPQSLAVVAGNTAVFGVGAAGSAPLYYQWYFNTNSPLTGATNSSHSLTNAQAGDEGAYSVVVSNYAGTATSNYASLTITTNAPNFEMLGFATVAGGTTGGAGGATNTITDGTAFRAACLLNVPQVILVQGALNLGTSTVYIRSNKTILGIGTNASLLGNIKMATVTNVIVRNVAIANPTGIGDNDCITIQDAQHIWIDHCTITDSLDGLCDIVDASDYVTFSWNKMFYTSNTGHNLSCLVGHSDSNGARDSGKLHVTFHHNWWGPLCIERMPRVRFGQVHSFNSYFNPAVNGNAITNHYCHRAALGAQLLIENNNFENVANPWERFVTTGSNGLVRASNNITNNVQFVNGWTTGAVVIPGTNDVFAPPYSYAMEEPTDVAGIVTNHAGAGKGPFAP